MLSSSKRVSPHTVDFHGWIRKRIASSHRLEHDVRITPSTVFHIASTSKQFTAFSILLLAQEGKLSLDDDVRKYLPKLHDFGKTITIRNLLQHTSGLRDQWDLLMLGGWRIDDVITEQDILGLVWRQKELNFDPGSEFLYCNTGYTLAAKNVERVSGKPLPEFTRERLFSPLSKIRFIRSGGKVAGLTVDTGRLRALRFMKATIGPAE